MAYILNLETSTTNCSVSVADNGEILALKEINDANYSHAENLHVFIEESLKEARIAKEQLDAVAVSEGPGSYTGLRIGVSAAKGLCFALDIPLLAVNTLKALALQAKFTEGVVIPMLDARRMEVYSAVFDVNLELVRETQAEIIEAESFEHYRKQGPVHLLGPGAEKCRGVLPESNIYFQEEVKFPSASEMAVLSYGRYKKGDTVDVAYFEPFYLKDFIAGSKSK